MKSQIATIILSGLIGAGMTAMPSSAAEKIPTDQPLTYNGHEYACTGIAESRLDPRWSRYPLKLVFVGAGGAYLGDVDVRIMRPDGTTAMRVHCPSPWLVADLPAGRYEVDAVANGRFRQTLSVNVGRTAQARHVVRYPEIREVAEAYPR